MIEVFNKTNFKEYVLFCSIVLNNPHLLQESVSSIEHLFKVDFNNFNVLQNNSNKDFEQIIKEYNLKTSCILAQETLNAIQFYAKKFNTYNCYELTIQVIKKIFRNNYYGDFNSSLNNIEEQHFYLFLLLINYEIFLRILQDKKFAKALAKNKVFNNTELAQINTTLKIYLNIPLNIQEQRFILINSKKMRGKIYA